MYIVYWYYFAWFSTKVMALAYASFATRNSYTENNF